MRVLVIGASGFLGTRLLKQLLADGLPAEAAGDPVQIVASDVRAPGPGWPGTGHAEVTTLIGDLRDGAFLAAAFSRPFDVVFHLAATLTIDAEQDFDLGLATNVHGLIGLLQACRAQSTRPRLIFASSISTFGGVLPAVVDDHVAQTPQTSYGVHKVIAEQLINDYSRRGFVDGRVLRLPIVLTHPGPPSGSVSDRLAALIREPLHGNDTHCPFEPHTPVAVTSASHVVKALQRVTALPTQAFAATRAMNLPAISTTPAAIVAAVTRTATARTKGRVHWLPDPSMQRLISSWPGAFTSEFAVAHGIGGGSRIEEIIADFTAESIGSVA